MNIEKVVCNYCGDPAQCFSLFQTQKLAACSTHIQTLVEKGFNSYPVEAYYFIDSPEDVSAYAERHKKVAVGLSNLSLWEKHFEEQYQATRRSLEASANLAFELIHRSFRELILQTDQIYAETKAGFDKQKANFRNFLLLKDNEIDFYSDILCGDGPFIPTFFRVTVADLTIPLVSTLRNHTQIVRTSFESIIELMDESKRMLVIQRALQDANCFTERGEMEFAMESQEFATKLGATNVSDSVKKSFDASRRRITRQILSLFPFTKDDGDVKRAAEAHYWDGIAEQTDLRYVDSRENLYKAWKLIADLQTENPLMAKIGFALGELLCCQFAKYEDALKIARICLEIEHSLNPVSDSAMRIRNLIAEIHDFQGDFRLSEEISTETITLIPANNLNSDEYWTALFFLCRALIDQFKLREAEVLIEAAIFKSKSTTSVLSEMLKAMLKAWVSTKIGTYSEAESASSHAKSLATEFFPSSIFAAFNLIFLAELVQSRNHEHLDRCSSLRFEAHAILSRHYPTSRYTRMNLFWLEVALKSHEILRIRELFCAELHEDYPAALETPKNFVALANSYYDFGMIDEAIEARRTANAIFSEIFVANMDTAVNLTCLGDLCIAKDEVLDAHTHYLESWQLHEAYHPTSNEAAFNLYRLAVFENAKGPKETALIHATVALTIWKDNGSSMAESHGKALVDYLSSKRSSVFAFNSIN